MPYLIVNADDFGRTAEVSRGIIEAHKKGIVTSTTTMINYDSAIPAVKLALEEAPMLGIGLHFVLTSGTPVSAPEDVPSLLEGGRFHGAHDLAPFAVNWDAGEVAREMRAQFDLFVKTAGKLPTHLDSHHHAIYAFPQALRVLLAIAEEFNLPVRRNPIEGPALALANSWVYKALPPAAARQIADQVIGLWSGSSVCMPDVFVQSFYDHTAILGELLTILTNLAPEGVTELMVHPGYAGGLDSTYNIQREKELETLTHPAAHEVIMAESVRLMSYADMV